MTVSLPSHARPSQWKTAGRTGKTSGARRLGLARPGAAKGRRGGRVAGARRPRRAQLGRAQPGAPKGRRGGRATGARQRGRPWPGVTGVGVRQVRGRGSLAWTHRARQGGRAASARRTGLAWPGRQPWARGQISRGQGFRDAQGIQPRRAWPGLDGAGARRGLAGQGEHGQGAWPGLPRACRRPELAAVRSQGLPGRLGRAAEASRGGRSERSGARWGGRGARPGRDAGARPGMTPEHGQGCHEGRTANAPGQTTNVVTNSVSNTWLAFSNAD